LAALLRVLSASYEVSHTVIREALRQVEADGLVTMVAHKRPEVTVMSRADVAACTRCARSWRPSPVSSSPSAPVTLPAGRCAGLRWPACLEGLRRTCQDRGAVTNGVTKSEIQEVLMQAAIYAGMPAALESFRIAEETLTELEAEGVEAP
jgi:hypothetical protein